MRECGPCRFCCFAWAVRELSKPALAHCRHECHAGCSIHGHHPANCRSFACPYLEGAPIHRPDTFQSVLECEIGDIGNYIPAIPVEMPAEEARLKIIETRRLPAFIIVDGQWRNVVLPLDREKDGNWTPKKSWETTSA